MPSPLVVHSTSSPSAQSAPSTLCTVPLLPQTVAVSLSSRSITIPEVLVGRVSYMTCALCCARASPAVTTAPTTNIPTKRPSKGACFWNIKSPYLEGTSVLLVQSTASGEKYRHCSKDSVSWVSPACLV